MLFCSDPGVTTGWALLGKWLKTQGKPEILAHGSFRLKGRGAKRLARLEEQMQEVISDLKEQGYVPTKALVEKLEGFSYARSMRSKKSLNQRSLQINREFTAIIELTLMKAGMEVETINPAQWKRGMAKDLTRLVKSLWSIECNNHTADAIIMGTVWMRAEVVHQPGPHREHRA